MVGTTALDEPAISVDEACRVLGVSRSTLYRKIEKGRLTQSEPGKVTLKSLDKFMIHRDGQSLAGLRREVTSLRERVTQLEELLAKHVGVSSTPSVEDARALIKKRHPELLG